MSRQNSSELFAESKKLVPGGVHSPIRSFKGLEESPIFFSKGEGAYLYDIEGKSYIDFCMSFGPLVLGHQNSVVKKDMIKSLEHGWTFGAAEPYSLDLAKVITAKIPHIEQVRFVSSGTEAVMTALRLARGYIGKNKILKFNGCYHGHVDSMLIKAGSGLAGESESSSKGVSSEVANETLILELGDFEGVAEVVQREKDLAAIIIEPLPANHGLLPQSQKFLEFLREITAKNNILLIFDEVISGFRAGIGGMSRSLKITPDLVTYGKVIGGGLPVGALAGPSSILEYLAPNGPVYQAGTLSGNPLAMVAGQSTLKQLTGKKFREMHKNTLAIVRLFEKWLQEFKDGEFKDYKIIQKYSLFWIYKGDRPKALAEFPLDLADSFSKLYSELLNRGVYLSPSAYEVGFCSFAHDEKVVGDLESRLFQ